ncbi:hypothetical protein LEN26_013399 [Aphanomyces euteiches]|nr:hypothetical protein LEN26_013399 [Aphanomyces euteiches]
MPAAEMFSLVYLLSAVPHILCLYGVFCHIICKPRGPSEETIPLLDQNFLSFMPGIDRQELEELLTDEERWTCVVCDFGNLASDSTCNLCGALPAVNLDAVTLNSRQRAARHETFHTPFVDVLHRRRKQWTRHIDTDGRARWIRHGDPSQLKTSWRIYTHVDPTNFQVMEEFVGGVATRPENRWPDMSTTPLQLHCRPIEDDKADASTTMLGTQLLQPIWEVLVTVSQLTFSSKYAWFLQQIAAMRVPFRQTHLEIKAARDHLLEDAKTELLKLRGPLRCAIARHRFQGEAAIDAGAVQREWYTLVASAFMDPEKHLFQVTNQSDNSYFLASQSRDTESHDDLFRVVGRFIGRALLDGQVIPMHLNLVVFKAILGLPIVFEDLEDFDPVVYKSLTYILECANVDELALSFSVSTVEEDGSMTQIDLVENGRNIAVENHNRVDFVQAMVHHLVFDRVESHLAGFIQGLYDIVPPELLLVFDHKELELILCGLPVVDVVDWKLNAVTSPNLRHSDVTDWFWEAVEAMEPQGQAKLLQISTGASRVPVQGFKGLTSFDGRICYFTLNGVPYKAGAYPVVHACFNRIDLPLYPTKELLQDALRMLLLSDPTGFNSA